MKTLRIVVGILLATFLCVYSNVAYAQEAQGMLCGERDEVVTQLQEKYQEVPRYIGVTNANTVMEIFLSENSWTMTITLPDGVTCLVGAGTVFEAIPLPAKKPAKGQKL